ncbi:MAG: hypothetical protein JWM86_1922 [Thermoleophilia bacterium]|nr:hypothetical protein [Thermoleophilia bacterium]
MRRTTQDTWGNDMGTTTAISIDRFRRRRADEAASIAPERLAHPLVGTTLGTLERRYGLMSSEETIIVSDVIATSGDLAVADRLAFVASMERHAAIVVVEFDGWYLACATERTLAPAELAHLRAPEVSPMRVMSIVTERGITPALGPLCA